MINTPVIYDEIRFILPSGIETIIYNVTQDHPFATLNPHDEIEVYIKAIDRTYDASVDTITIEITNQSKQMIAKLSVKEDIQLNQNKTHIPEFPNTSPNDYDDIPF
jgi:hypothetical protein